MTLSGRFDPRIDTGGKVDFDFDLCLDLLVVGNDRVSDETVIMFSNLNIGQINEVTIEDIFYEN